MRKMFELCEQGRKLFDSVKKNTCGTQLDFFQ